MKFYIKPQLSRHTWIHVLCCILFNFYIKPQLTDLVVFQRRSCILLNFYIKPQQQQVQCYSHAVVSYWISTSNHNLPSYWICLTTVVSYWISTSNHNFTFATPITVDVVSYWISTSNHNTWPPLLLPLMLYLIELLHKTTTEGPTCVRTLGCIYIHF